MVSHNTDWLANRQYFREFNCQQFRFIHTIYLPLLQKEHPATTLEEAVDDFTGHHLSDLFRQKYASDRAYERPGIFTGTPRKQDIMQAYKRTAQLIKERFSYSQDIAQQYRSLFLTQYLPSPSNSF
jgi:hypothetical protein